MARLDAAHMVSGVNQRIGARQALVMAIGTAVMIAAVAYALPRFIENRGDHDAYGSVAIPGERVLELPRGEVAVFYQERIADAADPLRDDGGLTEPSPEPDYEVRPAAGGEPLELDADGGREVSGSDERRRVEIERLDVPAAGAYRVTGRSIDRPQANDPELTFGSFLFDWTALVILFVGATLGALIVVAGLLDLPARIREARHPGRRSAGWG